MRLLTAFFLGFTLICSLNAAAQTKSADSASNVTPDRFDINDIDRSVDPCVNFYAYTCNKWMAANPIPSDEASWSHWDKLELWNENVLKQVLEEASKEDSQRSAVDQKIGDYYASCMDESAINSKGAAAIQPELDRIAALNNKSQLATEIAHIHAITFQLAPGTESGSKTAAFGFGSGQDFDNASMEVAQVDQGGLGLPDRDYYTRDDAKSTEVRQQYATHIQKMLALLGEDPEQASADAKVVMDMETALAKASMDIVKRRDPANMNHKMTLQQLQALTPDFSWNDYLKAVNAAPTDHYLVLTPDFYKGLNQLIDSQSLDNWKIYLRWHLVNNSASLLSKPFVDEHFDFFGRKLFGEKEQQPRWRRCTRYIDRDLGEALGQAYVQKAFSPEEKQRTLKLVHELEASLGSDIQQLDWMSPETKKQALVKLHAIEDKIGYPNHWRDYSSVNIVRGDALGDAYRSGEFELRRQMDRIGKPVDRGEWLMTPPTVNAYYDPQLNTINFPAGILQPPFFDNNVDDAVNLGAIGMIIGHELTHGFDDEGSKFDPQGNLRNWWTADDAKKFKAREQCISSEYSGFEATPGTKLNGDLTLGENTADNGGLRIAYMTMENSPDAKKSADSKTDGLTPEQRFFVSYGQVWCSNMTPEVLRFLAQANPHSPPQARINGVVSNMPEFQKAFSCKKGQPMVRENQCRVW
ncbi:MAG TPA: M13 family metallopeptidase [Terriglobales bacterium]|nr:M13 family metallopeptidase [Terriglobales bacterium]